MKNKNIDVIYFHVHLVSDSTGETLVEHLRASCSQYQHGIPIEHLHALVRSQEQLEKAIKHIENYPGLVFYTLVNKEKRKRLEEKCAQLNITAISILDPSLSIIGRYLGERMSSEIGAQRVMDENYFSRIDALDFAMQHDDGQNIKGLKNADIIIIGVSRTSKTPTCIYLANRGFMTGNIPLVDGQTLPEELVNYKKPLIVGLVSSPDRIVQIRRQRINEIGAEEIIQTKGHDYIDKNKVRREMINAKRIFNKYNWPIVDVTRKSIEETSAKIINLYQEKKLNE